MGLTQIMLVNVKQRNTIEKAVEGQDLALRLWWFRRMLGMTQNELSVVSGISRETIAKYENGDLIPSGKNIVALANGLKMETDDFLTKEIVLKL